jgi:transcriptional antiterminator RfaH
MNNHIDFWKRASWFAVQTKSHQESFAAARVAKQNLKIFLPQVRDQRPIRSGVRNITKALFPGYFFTRFCPLESLEAVRHTHGVLRVVGSGRIPIAVGSEIISSIQARIHPDGLIRLTAREFQPGERVAIEHGPFEGMMGRVEREPDGRERVTILLEELLHARVSVEKTCLSTAAA